MVIICVIGVICVAALLVGIASQLESTDFNGGMCRECNVELRHFDSDSHGGRGYVCDYCEHIVWVSWPWVDRKRRKGENDLERSHYH